MAIKKRAPMADADREKAIEAFGDAAVGEGVQSPTLGVKSNEASSPAVAKADVVSLRMLLRFSDEELPRRLQELAKQHDRSKHNMTLIALRAGIESLESNK